MNFALGAAAVLVASLVGTSSTYTGPIPYTANARLALATSSTAYGLMMIGTIVRTLSRNRDPVVRKQAIVMLSGVLLHGATAETYAYLRIGGQFPPPFLTASALIMAASFTIAILRYRMFDVTPRPEDPVAYPRKFPLRPGRAYVARERRPDLGFRALAEAVRQGDVGLVITRLPPTAVREGFDLEQTTILSLTSVIGQNTIPPTQPEILERLVSRFPPGRTRAAGALQGGGDLPPDGGVPSRVRTL